MSQAMEQGNPIFLIIWLFPAVGVYVVASELVWVGVPI